MINAREIVGSFDVILITLDSLRYDVACNSIIKKITPNLDCLLPNGTWEKRHAPANFTLPSHLSMFAGFFPTPIRNPKASRLFAVRFPQNDTITSETYVFNAPNIIKGFEKEKYHTVCIGGVGFFNKSNYLGNLMPSLFLESYWNPSLGVASRISTKKQVNIAIEVLKKLHNSKRIFLFINVSAIHRPSHIFLKGARRDSIETQEAALNYVDSNLPPLFKTLQKRGSCLVIICSDHGEAFGEDGYWGHRFSHPVIWNVPYTEFILPEE